MLTLLDRRRAARKAAMPEVKKLVKKYSRAAVYGCLMQIRAHDKAVQKIERLRKEAAALARKL